MFKPGYLLLYFACPALTAHLPASLCGPAALCGICSGLIFITRLLAPLEARP